jgi:transcriptional regulator with XRE-family HTH domain
MAEDICEGPAKNADVQLRVLHEACLAVGGEHHLAARLGVSAALISDWLNGIGHPSDEIFLRCVDLLGETDPSLA